MYAIILKDKEKLLKSCVTETKSELIKKLKNLMHEVKVLEYKNFKASLIYTKSPKELVFSSLFEKSKKGRVFFR